MSVTLIPNNAYMFLMHELENLWFYMMVGALLLDIIPYTIFAKTIGWSPKYLAG